MRNRCSFFAILALLALSNFMQAQQAPLPQSASSDVTPTTPSPDEDGFYRLGPGIVAPVLVHPIAVTGPYNLIKKCTPRTVVISAVIGIDGAAGVRQVQQAGDTACESAAIDAIMKSSFEAGTLSGKPVPVLICLAVSFLENAKEALPSIQPCPDFLSTMAFDGQSVYRIGGAVKAPVLTVHPAAQFSDEARRAKYQGICLIGLIVDAQGNPQDVHVARTLGMGLDEKALEAVRSYRFKPAVLNGKPVPVQVTVEIDFRLYQRP